ncbi:MAG: pyridoxal phosphate-dependent aminotransferase [Planctomycetota bacterium]|nr:MAG: pyridoxal phosphate-dependent aminotransferase [Planctomycetota bacterium]
MHRARRSRRILGIVAGRSGDARCRAAAGQPRRSSLGSLQATLPKLGRPLMPRPPIARRIAEQMQASSWVREMFERGLRLRAERGAENVFDFSLGNPNADPPEEFFMALRSVAAEREPALHRYMPNAGFPEARAAVARFVADEYGLDVDGSSVVLTTGAAGGLNVTMRALCEPGDEVIVLAPFFPEYRFYVEQAGATLVVVQTDDAFQPDIEALRAALTPRTRAIIVNSPNNPTGALYTDENCRALARVMSERDGDDNPLYLVLDDPYRRIVFDVDRAPSAAAYYARTILVSSYSKDLSIPGERAGYIAVPATTPGRSQILGALTMLNRTLGMVNLPAFMQRVITRCASACCDISRYRANRDRLCGALREMGYELPWPGGAMFAFPRTPIDDLEFVELLMQHNILVVPGRGFGRAGHMRISFAVDPETIERALPGFAAALESPAVK